MNRSRAFAGFTIIELLVTVAIVGILMGMLIPAVSAVRSESRRSQCMNNLRQLSIASQNFESAQGFIPPAARFGEGTGWHAYILPYIERQELYEQIMITDPEQNFEWSADGKPVLETILPVFKCPSDPAPPFVESQFSDFVSSAVLERGVCSYLACASGTVPDVASDLRSSKLELKIGDESDALAQTLVRGMRSGAMTPTQTFIDHSTLNSPYPKFQTKVKYADILDGTSNTILLGEGIFDTSHHFNLAGDSRSVGMDHWYIGSGDMDISIASQATTNPVRDFSEFMATTAIRFNYYHFKRAQLDYDGLGDSLFRDQLSYSFNSWHSGDGINFALTDGSAKWIRAGVDPEIRANLGMIADRKKVGDF